MMKKQDSCRARFKVAGAKMPSIEER